jgi:hypothetical protein
MMVTVSSALIYALHAYCYMPLHCNVIENQVEARSLSAFRGIGSLSGEIVARKNLRDLEPCTEIGSTDVNYYMIRAANFQIIGETAAAVQEYEHALLYDRRPEIYLNLGLQLLQMGNAVAGERALVSAGLFNPDTIDEIPYDNVRASVQRQVSATFASWSAARPGK